MNADTRLWVGGIIAFALLALYGYVLVLAILRAMGLKAAPPGDNAFWILQAVGTLVSAVVAAQLAVAAVTPPGQKVAFFGEQGGDRAVTVAIAYLALWLVLGLAAVVFGLVQPKVDVPELATFAKGWIGLAIAAGYAFFGLHAAGTEPTRAPPQTHAAAYFPAGAAAPTALAATSALRPKRA